MRLETLIELHRHFRAIDAAIEREIEANRQSGEGRSLDGSHKPILVGSTPASATNPTLKEIEGR